MIEVSLSEPHTSSMTALHMCVCMFACDHMIRWQAANLTDDRIYGAEVYFRLVPCKNNMHMHQGSTHSLVHDLAAALASHGHICNCIHVGLVVLSSIYLLRLTSG